jgi:type I restriction enzyme, S subunit
MRKGWEMKKLGDVLQKTETIDPTKNPEKEFIYIDVSSIDNEKFIITNTSTLKGKDAPSRARKLLKENDIIFATVRPTLKRIAIIPNELDGEVCSTGYFVLRASDIIHYKLLYFYLQTDEFISSMEKLQKGASYPAVTDGEVRQQLISFPKQHSQQEYIVYILEETFAAIEQAKENLQRNLQNAKELFQSELNNIFLTEGNSWEKKKLNQVSQNLDNKRIPITKNVRSSGEYPYYGASGIVDYVGEYIFNDDLLLVSEDGANLLARTYPIAFSIRGKTWVNNHAHVLKFENIVSQKFVEYYLNSIKLDDFVSGMAQPKLNQTMLNTIPIPFPTISVQKKILDRVGSLSVQTKTLENIYQQKLDSLEELKKSILQKAFSGELTIKRTAVT